MSHQVHWHEGLFLQPHHFQVQQHGWLEQFRTERRLAWHYPYGVIESRMADKLEAKIIEFEKLHVIMPSGIEVHYPVNAELPFLDNLRVMKALSRSPGGFVVYLGVPRWSDQRANAFGLGQVGNSSSLLLYRAHSVPRNDENTGENSKQIHVRMINARLIIEGEETPSEDDIELLPVLRVTRDEQRADDVPRQDLQFVPPCLVLRGSPTLRRKIADLAAKLEGSRDECAQKLARGGLGVEVRMNLTLRLRTLAHFAPNLSALAEAPAATPFGHYLLLRTLHGELAALAPNIEELRCAPYTHADPLACFEELDRKIRSLLREKRENVVQIKFVTNAKGHPQAALSKDNLTRPTAYFLGVKLPAAADRAALSAYVTGGKKFRLMPASMEGMIVPGVDLKEETFPPSELPAQTGLFYFRLLLKESPRWEAVERDESLVLVWFSTDPDATRFALAAEVFSLCLTLPS